MGSASHSSALAESPKTRSTSSRKRDSSRAKRLTSIGTSKINAGIPLDPSGTSLARLRKLRHCLRTSSSCSAANVPYEVGSLREHHVGLGPPSFHWYLCISNTASRWIEARDESKNWRCFPHFGINHSLGRVNWVVNCLGFSYFPPWISCRLHTRIGSRNFDATASAAARAPLRVVIHGTRCCTALRRIDFSSSNEIAPLVV